MSNVLALPLVSVGVQTGNNEDWVDSIKYVVDPADGTTDSSLWEQLDLRGISFSMEIRRDAADVEVIFGASTENGTLKIGDAPDFGFLIIQVPLAEMKDHPAGTYVGDIVGTDGIYTRTTIQIALEILEGITKQPVNKRIVVTYP